MSDETHEASRQDSESPWWTEYFSSLYGELYRGPLAEDLGTEEEVETLARVFGGATVVADLGCGFGRHLVPLRKKGISVFGFDYSRDLLTSLPKRQQKFLARADLRTLPIADEMLDGAYMMFNTFGYFSAEDNVKVLKEVARSLKPGGTLVMDIPSRTGMVKAAKDLPASIRAQGGMSMTEFWGYDEASQRLEARGTWESSSAVQEWFLSIALYTPSEIQKLLKAAGFKGIMDFRPLEEIEDLGSEKPAPPFSAGVWRTATNMVVMAVR